MKWASPVALVHEPDLLILDEPTTGVDPLSRRQFWSLIDGIRGDRPSMSVVIATAYMDEAQRWDWNVAMDAGRVLATGTPAELMRRTGTRDLEECFIALLPEEKTLGHKQLVIPPRAVTHTELAIRRLRARESASANRTSWSAPRRRKKPNTNTQQKSTRCAVICSAGTERNRRMYSGNTPHQVNAQASATRPRVTSFRAAASG